MYIKNKKIDIENVNKSNDEINVDKCFYSIIG